MLQLGVTSLLTSVVLAAFVIYFVQYIWRRRWLYYHASKLDGPFAFPIIGSAYLFLGGQDGLCDQLMKLFEKYQSSMSKVWLGNMLFVIVPKLDDVETVLNNCLAKPPLYDFVKAILGNGILTAPVETWKPNRKIINLTFNQNILNSFTDTFVDQANYLVHQFDQCLKKDHVNVWPFMFEASLNSICATSLGSEVNGMDGTRQYTNWLARSLGLILSRTLKFWFHFEFLWKLSSLSKELIRSSNQMSLYVGRIVESKRLEKSNGHVVDQQECFSNNGTIPPRKKIFLDLLLDITDHQERWKNEQLMDETNTLLVTSSETTAIVTSSVILMLAMHQDIQEKAYEEVFDIFGDSDRPCTSDDLGQMRYLELVIKETIRLFPVAPLLSRTIDKDLKLGNQTVPKGSTLVVPMMMIHRSAQYWKDPLKFDPERFLPEEVAKRHKYAYMAFSLGPRDCVGKIYAMMSMKIFLSTVLRNFKLTSTPYKSIEDVKLLVNMLLVAKNGYNVQIERRENRTVDVS